MPIYESLCGKCGKAHEYYQTSSRRHETPECCGVPTEKRIFTACFGIVDIPAYVSPTTGKWINSRKERAEDLKASNARPWEGMEQEQKEAERRKAYAEAEQDAKLEKCIETTLAEMPVSAKEELGVL